VADLDCPEGGCFGIAFTLPASFQTDPATDPLTALRPFQCLPNAAPWDVTLADPALPGGTDRLLTV
jgi:hypothetical protein